MPEIKPFRATMFHADVVGDLGLILCPPYDVISEQDQARLYLRSPHNVVRLELGQDHPGDSLDNNRYTRANELLQSWLGSGVMRDDDEPSLYLYDQHWEGRKRRSLFAAVKLASWSDREVLPHEQTLSGPKQDRLLLLRHTAANLSPVMALYDDMAGIVRGILAEASAQRPWRDVSVPGVSDRGGTPDRHCLWRVAAPASVARIQQALLARPFIIADGHHRYETALAYRNERQAAKGFMPGQWDYVLMCLLAMDDPGLVVLPTHRLIRTPRFNRERFFAALAEVFQVEPLFPSSMGTPIEKLEKFSMASTGSHEFGLCVSGQESLWHLRLRLDVDSVLGTRGRSAPWRQLDVALLHYLVLDEILGIPEASWKGGDRIVYTRDVREVLVGMASGEFQVGVVLRSTPVGQICDVAEAGDVMPQKSTYFYPKVPTGLLMHRLDEVPALDELQKALFPG